MSTTPPTPAAPLPGDPATTAPNGGAPSVVAEAIDRRDADRAARATLAERRASRF